MMNVYIRAHTHAIVEQRVIDMSISYRRNPCERYNCTMLVLGKV